MGLNNIKKNLHKTVSQQALKLMKALDEASSDVPVDIEKNN